jgi:hypothetical protein
MAFKMRGWNAGEGTGSAKKFRNTMAPNQEMMGARQSPMMKVSWKEGEDYSTGKEGEVRLNKWVAERNKIKAKYKGTSNPKGYKDDPAYQAAQNKINTALGSDKRHGQKTEIKTSGKKTETHVVTPGIADHKRTDYKRSKLFGEKIKRTRKSGEDDYSYGHGYESKDKKTKKRFKGKRTETGGWLGETTREFKNKGRIDEDGKEIKTKAKLKKYDKEGKLKYTDKSKYDKKGETKKEKTRWKDDGTWWKDKYGKDGSVKAKYTKRGDDGSVTKIKKKYDKEGKLISEKTKTRKKWGTGIGAKIKEKLKNKKNKKD